ncbi:kelch repeat-containing protein [Thermodesulfobacteriota bacterium]
MKLVKFLFLVVFILSNAIVSQGEESWTFRNPLPTPRTGGDAVILNDGTIMVMGGGSPGIMSLDTVEIYDPLTDIWSSGPSMPEPRRSFSSNAVGDKVYVFGGKLLPNDDTRNTVFNYDLTTNAWTILDPMPYYNSRHVSEVIGDYIYMISGYAPGLHNKVSAYNTVTNTWVSKAPIPTARYGAGSCVLNGKIYIAGGWAQRARNEFEVYDPVTDTWESDTLSHLPTARAGLALDAIENKIYAIGGHDGTNTLDLVEIYDPTTNTWSAGLEMPIAQQDASSVVVNDKVILFGGLSSDDHYDYVQEYNPDSVSQNQPPSTPILVSPLNNAFDIDPNNLTLEWNSSTDPDGDTLDYLLIVNEFGPNNDITLAIVTIENSHVMQLDPNKIYSWFVYAADEVGNVSNQSESSYFSTKTGSTVLLSDFNGLGYDVNFFEHESIYSIVRNCIDYDDYTYSKWHLETTPNNLPFPFSFLLSDPLEYPKLYVLIDDYFRGRIKDLASENNNPRVFSDYREQVTPWLDASWGNEINQDNHFNTVYAVEPNIIQDMQDDENFSFEVISCVDEAGPRFIGTDNFNSYFFTYDTKGENTSECVDLESWVNYLESVRNHYSNIDTLTIFAHGKPGSITISDIFSLNSTLLSNQDSLEEIQRLRNILSEDSSILIFSCNVGKGEDGKNFVKELANATHATVFANSANTGFPIGEPGNYSQEWDLDVIAIPDDYFLNAGTTLKTIPVSKDSGKTIMLPGGISVEIESNDLTNDGFLQIENVLSSFSQDDTVVGAYNISIDSQITENNSIKITIPYNSDLINFHDSSLAVKFWDEDSSEWSGNGIWDILIRDGYVIFKTNHTTIFAVIEVPTPENMDNNGDGGGAVCFLDTLKY